MISAYYIAFVVDHDICERGAVVVEAGVDLLAGPFPSEAAATQAFRETCLNHQRLAACAGLAHFLYRDTSIPPVRLEIVRITLAQLARYNRRHPEGAVTWPLDVVAPTLTEYPNPAPQRTVPITGQKGRPTHAAI